MRGRIWVESEVGKGTTFHFTAPFGVAAAESQRAPSADARIFENMRVLVVDDNATNRQILEKILTHWRMRPAAVDGAKPALALLKQAKQAKDPFVLMITDRHMPETDGFMLAEQIQKTAELAGLVMVMLTSGGHRGDGARCAELGIAAYLMKPVLQSDLLEMYLESSGGAPRGSSGSKAYYGRDSSGRSRGRCMFCWRKTIASTNGWRRVCWRNGDMWWCWPKTAHGLWKCLHSRASTLSSWMCKCRYWMACKPPRPFGRRERTTGIHIPIIAMTAHAMGGDRQRFLASGMDGYISKPVHSRELFQMIDSLLGLSTALTAAADSLEVGFPMGKIKGIGR